MAEHELHQPAEWPERKEGRGVAAAELRVVQFLEQLRGFASLARAEPRWTSPRRACQLDQTPPLLGLEAAPVTASDERDLRGGDQPEPLGQPAAPPSESDSDASQESHLALLPL